MLQARARGTLSNSAGGRDDQLPHRPGRRPGPAGDHGDHPPRAQGPEDRFRQHHRGPDVARPPFGARPDQRPRRRRPAAGEPGGIEQRERPDPARSRPPAPEPALLAHPDLRARPLDRVQRPHQ